MVTTAAISTATSDSPEDGKSTSAATQGAPSIQVRGLTKRYVRKGRSKEVITPVDNVDLEVAADELVLLLGPSGCGKTTLLRCVAGLERPDSGEIIIDGKVVFSADKGIFLPPEQRGINMMFQSYALWPHMSIEDNVAFPLRMKKTPRNIVAGRVKEALDMVGLGHLGASHPGHISGGQQQRVALARAIVSQDKVVLFDEPLSNVDAKVRERLRLEILQIKRKLGFSALYVTHDQDEAMEMADRIAVLLDGKVAQYDEPRTIYDRPASVVVGNFVGTANLIDARGPSDGSECLRQLDSEIGPMTALTNAKSAMASRLAVLSRPENWTIGDGPAEVNSWQGVVEHLLFCGANTHYHVRVGDKQLRLLSRHARLADVGDTVWVSIAPEHLLALPASE